MCKKINNNNESKIINHFILFIYSGLSSGKLLYHMWLFLGTLGPHCGLKAFLDLLAVNTKCTAPEFHMLILFCDCMTNYIACVFLILYAFTFSIAKWKFIYYAIFRLLDDMNMYETQDPFKISDFITMSYFLNQFLYKAVLNNLFGKYNYTTCKSDTKNITNFKLHLFLSFHICDSIYQKLLGIGSLFNGKFYNLSKTALLKN